MSKQPKIPVSEKISKALLDGALPVAAVTVATDLAQARSHQVQVSSLDSMSFSLKKGPLRGPEAIQNITEHQTEHQQESLARLDFTRTGGLKLSKQNKLDDAQTSMRDAEETYAAEAGQNSLSKAKVLDFSSRISPGTKNPDSTNVQTPEPKEPEGK